MWFDCGLKVWWLGCGLGLVVSWWWFGFGGGFDGGFVVVLWWFGDGDMVRVWCVCCGLVLVWLCCGVAVVP